MTLLLGLGIALVAAALYSFGATLQAMEARDTSGDESLKLSLLGRLLTRRRWIAGTVCVVGGWLLQVTALFLAPLTVVQPALATSVVVLLLIGMWVHGEAVSSRDVLAAAAVVTGVIGLAAVAPPHSGSHADPQTMAIGMLVLGFVAVVPYALGAKQRVGALVAVSAGLAYAWTAFSTKFLADGMSAGAWPVGIAWFVATGAAAVVGLMSEMTALQTRSAIRVFPVVLVVQVVVAVMLAPLLAGERWNPDAETVAVMVTSVVALAMGTYTLASAPGVGRVVAAERS